MTTFAALIAFGAILYTYVGYPMILWLASIFFRRLALAAPPLIESWPMVAVVVTLHNGSKHICKKMANLASIEYPGKISIHYVLDGCTDDTESQIREHSCLASHFPVHVHVSPQRFGKESAIRDALPKINAEVLMFTDADAEFEPNTVHELVKVLLSGKVGAACGLETHRTRGKMGAGSGEGLYYRYENFVKSMQSQFTSLAYIQGGVFALWKKLYPPVIPAGATQDGIIAFHIVSQGYRVAFAPIAKSIEYYDLTIESDFKRRVRTISRAFYSILCSPYIFNPLRTGSYGFHVCSARIFRWLTIPFAMIGSLLLIPGLLEGQPIAIAVFAFEVVWLCLTLVGLLMEKAGRRSRLPYFCFYFTYIHVAAVVALKNVLFGSRVVVWAPTSIGQVDSAGDALSKEHSSALELRSKSQFVIQPSAEATSR